MKINGLWATAFFAALTLTADTASAQSYPNRPITVVMPFAGGSASDVVSRILFNKMATILGQPIIVENKPGAGGNIGTMLAAKAPPDGYTLVGAASGPMAANLTLYKDLGYDPQKELVLISPFASFTIVVAASNKLGLTTINDLIQRATKEPGMLNYGSVGIGSSQHLAGEYFAQASVAWFGLHRDDGASGLATIQVRRLVRPGRARGRAGGHPEAGERRAE